MADAIRGLARALRALQGWGYFNNEFNTESLQGVFSPTENLQHSINILRGRKPILINLLSVALARHCDTS